MSKVVKPTAADKLVINEQLAKKYPGRKYRIKKKGLARIKQKLKAVFGSGSGDTIRTKAVSSQLSKNLSKDEIRRLRGK